MKYIAILFSCLLFSFFVSGQAQQPVDKEAIPSIGKLLNNLKKNQGKGIMFGQQDALSYGVGWFGATGNSDIKIVTGVQPAIYGWDLAHIELDSANNLDGVPFTTIREYIIKTYKEGALNTISWHLRSPLTGRSAWDDNKTKNPTVKEILRGGKAMATYKIYMDKVATFLLSLKTPEGEMVPIVFRPYHENDGDWFWWGAKHCTASEYKKLYQITADYLKSKNVHNLAYAYSPDRGPDTEKKYLERYPGDNYVDILGQDNYWNFTMATFKEEVVKRLHMLAAFGEKHNKPFALTETGLEGVKENNWFTGKLLACLDADDITRKTSWVLVWRNFSTKHHYVPYKDHPAEQDFVKFKENPLMFFEDKRPELYK
jgi:mannan endo-1,4-beta-mannosidase